MKSKIIISAIFIFNITGIILNGNNFFMGNNPTYLNCAFSIFYVLLWISSSIYAYRKKELKFLKYMLIYWPIALVVSILYAIIVVLNTNGTTSGIFSNLNIFSNIIGLFDFILFSPLYGLRLFLQFPITKYSVIIIAIPLMLIILAIGIFKDSKN